MKRIIHALEQHEAVFVELPDTAAAARFQIEAAAAGFCFGDGAALRERPLGAVMAVHSNRTVCYPGTAGMTAYQCRTRPVIRFDP